MQCSKGRKNKLSELQTIISRMPLDVFCVKVLPELDIPYGDVAKAVRNARLPLQPASVARVFCRHVAKALSEDEIQDIVARLRLILVVTQTRTWHVIRLLEKTTDEPVTNTIRALQGRVMQALRKNKRGMRPEVQTALLGDLMYLSVQLVSEIKEGSVLYVATPPGEPVLLVSSTSMVGLLKACVEGLGYKKYANANLYGRDVRSLLRINDGSWGANADHFTEVPEYAPTPVITSTGIDFTNKQYNENYVDNLLGPDPPLLTDLNIKTTSNFFDSSRLNKQITIAVNIKSDDIAKSLKCWARKGALAPTSDLFHMLRQITSNKICYNQEDSDYCE